MTPEQKAWIDGASYLQLLDYWRFSPIGSSLFQGECGEYYRKVMEEKRDAITHEERVRASKDLEWGWGMKKIKNKNDEIWERLAAYFLVFVFSLAMGYAWRYAQEDIREKTDPDKIVVIRHCKEVAQR